MDNKIINQQEAQNLHKRIMSNQSIMAHALVSLCRDLKLMRDEKLYIHLGYETFENYAEEMANIKQRQAYAYISTYERLGPKFIEENENLGITKLELVAKVGVIDRQEFLDNNDVENDTVRVLQQKIKELTHQGEQMSLQLDEAKKENADYEKKLQDVVVASDAELEKVKAENSEMRKSLENSIDVDAEIEKAIKAEKEKTELLKKDYESKIKKAREEGASSSKEKIAKLKSDNKRLETKLAETAKEVKVSKCSEDLVSLKIIFNNLQSTANNMMGLLQKVAHQDPTTAEKLSGAIKNYLNNIAEKI